MLDDSKAKSGKTENDTILRDSGKQAQNSQAIPTDKSISF